eukprot:jgi/Bigna1/125851/aug1.1_g559
MSDETLRRVLEVKVDIEEMRGAGKLERGVNACAVKAVRRWAREWISHSATASMSESAEDGDDDIPANIRHLQGFKAWLLNLNLPKDFGIAEVVQDADAKIGELTKHCRRVIVGKKKKKKKLGGAGKRRGTVTVIGGEEKHGGVKKLETDDNKGDDDLYVPSPRRGKNKTIVVPLTRTSSQIFGEQKSALHNDRRHRLQDQADKLVKQLLPIQRELELTAVRLDQIDAEENDNPQLLNSKRHLPMSRIYIRAMRNALNEGDIQDMSDIYKQLRALKTRIPADIETPASLVYARLSKFGSGSDRKQMDAAVGDAYRDLYMYFRKVGMQHIALKYCCLYREAHRAVFGDTDRMHSNEYQISTENSLSKTRGHQRSAAYHFDDDSDDEKKVSERSLSSEHNDGAESTRETKKKTKKKKKKKKSKGEKGKFIGLTLSRILRRR